MAGSRLHALLQGSQCDFLTDFLIDLERREHLFVSRGVLDGLSQVDL